MNKNYKSDEFIQYIIEESQKINPDIVAEEVLKWVDSNVENFIDNQTRIFKLDLIIDTKEKMNEIKKIQDLYRKIAEFEDTNKNNNISEDILDSIIKCRKIMDEVVKKSYIAMKTKKELINNLFKHMAFYYEKILPDPQSKIKAFEIDAELKKLIKQKEEAPELEKEIIHKKIIDKINEGISLLKFIELKGTVDIVRFEYEAFEVAVKVKNKNDDSIKTEYIIPEGFVLWIKIIFSNLLPLPQNSLF